MQREAGPTAAAMTSRFRSPPRFWTVSAAMAGWQASRRTTPGGQAWYSDVAIELVLTLRLVLHLALRQPEGFATAVDDDPSGSRRLAASTPL
jgi:DDE family transposase